MFEKFYPDLLVNSISEINYSDFYSKGYKAIIFDIDNTLVPHNAPATEDTVRFFEELRSIGFSTMILSNNKEKRVKPFASAVKSRYIHSAFKPSVKGYITAMKAMDAKPSNTLFVGDQLYTDVWGGKKAGVFTILVHPINKKEEIQIVFKRLLERPVINSYLKNHHRNK